MIDVEFVRIKALFESLRETCKQEIQSRFPKIDELTVEAYTDGAIAHYFSRLGRMAAQQFWQDCKTWE